MNTTLIGGSPAREAPQVVELGARTGLGNVQRGRSQGDYVGCCSRSSQASRSTYTRHTPMPVSHPLGWEEPVSCSRENGNIQVQETSHPAWQHVFFGSEHTAPTLRQAAHSRGADAPPKRFQRGAPRQDNQTVEESPMAEDKFTEFTSRGRVNRTKRPCLQFQVLEPSIGPEHLAKYHTKSG